LKKIIYSESTEIIVFVAVVLISRVPFLFSGYGLDADAWEVALTAKRISQTGIYEVSRFPGFPVHEIVCSMFSGSYVMLNLLSTILSTIGFLFFVYTLKALRFKAVMLAGFALAAVPVVYIHSTTTIDYTWALAFILIALYFVVKDKPFIAGIFLGIAVGCRITSGGMVIPFAIMVSQSGGLKNNLKRIAKLVVTTCVVGGLLFLPVFFKYGTAFFTYYDVPYPSIPEVLYKFSIGVWGVAGFAALIGATCVLFVSDRFPVRKYLFPRAVNEKYVVAWLIAIDLYIIAFLKLPMESGYLIPIVPFVILLFGKYLFDKAFILFALILIISPFVANITPLNRLDAPTETSLAIKFRTAGEDLIFDPLKGPIISYESRRNNAMKYTSRVLLSLDTIQHKSLIIAGRWYTQLMVERTDTAIHSIQFIDHIKEKKLLEFIEQGFEIYYLPHQDQANYIVNNFDVKTFGAMQYMDSGK
jgi:hypothetical protein